MKAGALRHVVTIQAPGVAKNSYDEPVAEWTDVADVRASVEPLAGVEQWRGMQVQASVTHGVEIRYRAGLTSAHRLVFKGRTLNIGVIRDWQERNVKLLIQCTEKT